MRAFHLLPGLVLPGLVLLHLCLAPDSKVEESFHIQAVHDIEAFGIPIHDVSRSLRQNYDHFAFPGAVPRSFVGAVFLAGLSRPCVALHASVDRQLLARAILGLFNACALVAFGRGIRRAYGQTAAVWYLLFQASQFHVLYYASRTLSNMFAFGIVTLAMRYLIPEPMPRDRLRKRCALSLYLLTVAGVVFRAELALLLATTAGFLLAAGHVRIGREVVQAGLLGAAVGLATTVAVDSFFWQQFPLWPELAAFRFNVVHGQASAWGVQPWHFYFSNALPRLLLNPLVYLGCLPFALVQRATRPAAVYFSAPSLAFLALYSFQPHKEWRFVVYVVPPLTAAAALGASYVWTHRSKSPLLRLVSVLLLLSTAASFSLANFVFLPASAANYPGARALRVLHAQHQHQHQHQHSPVVSVYLGNLACQTGVTRFLQDSLSALAGPPSWTYDKTENPTLKAHPAFWTRFTYALVEPGSDDEAQLLRLPAAFNSAWHPAASPRWSLLASVDGFAGVRLVRPGDADADADADADIDSDSNMLGIGRAGDRSAALLAAATRLARKHLTRGWWAELKTEPRINIYQRVLN